MVAMKESQTKRRPIWRSILMAMAVGLLALVCFSVTAYRPDRPLPTIVPGSSSGPAFAVKIIRPRAGLPLGGILPPRFFGLDADIGFDSASAGASIGAVGPGLLELRADNWDVVFVIDQDGQVTSETQAVFDIIFEDQPRKVLCRPGDEAVGTFRIAALPGSNEYSGSFEIELEHCEDAVTGVPLGWPPQPFVVQGSFDRLPMGDDDDRQ